MKILDFLQKEMIPFQDLSLYKEAFTHASYTNETGSYKKHYERLEFMGDAVLQLYVSQFLFQLFPDVPEGTLTTIRSKLVREESLARFSKELGLGELINLGVGEEKSGGRQRESVLADIFESFIGALYLDCGEEDVLKILSKTLFRHVHDLDHEDITDYKTTLQELIQADQRKTVVYEVMTILGPSNAPVFKVAVMMDNMRLGIGKGTSKKRAEQQAAKDALDKLAKSDYVDGQ